MKRWEDMDELDRVEANAGLWEPVFVDVTDGIKTVGLIPGPVVAGHVRDDDLPLVMETRRVALDAPVPMFRKRLLWRLTEGNDRG